MLIPASFYGTYAEVKRRFQRSVTQLRRGASWEEAVGAGDVVDTANVPGLLVTAGPSPLLKGQTHFHCYVAHFLIRQAMFQQRLTPEVTDRVFEDSLRSLWGVLGLIGEPNQGWLYPPARHLPLVQATIRFWEVLDGEGERYSTGLEWGQRLWQVQRGLSYALAQLGVPQGELQVPLPSGGLAALWALHQARPGGVP
jgi:hypothetical protein